MADFETELARLNEVYQNRFISEEEHTSRTQELYAKYGRTLPSEGLTISSGLARPSSTPAEYYEDFEEDEDFDDEWWECNGCDKPIFGVRYHCYQCGDRSDEGFDLCRLCKQSGRVSHDPGHTFQILRPSDYVIPSERSMQRLCKEQSVIKGVRVLRPCTGVNVLEVTTDFGDGIDRAHFFTVADGNSSAADHTIQSLTAGLTGVVWLSDEQTQRELAEREREANAVVPGQNFTSEELRIVADGACTSEELALSALERCQGSVPDAIAYLDEEEEEEEEEAAK